MKYKHALVKSYWYWTHYTVEQNWRSRVKLMEFSMVDFRPFMRWICDHSNPGSSVGLDAGVRSAGSSRSWVEPMELTMADSVCLLDKYLGHKQLQSVVGLHTGVSLQEAQECSGQWKSIRSWKCSEVEVGTEIEMRQKKTRWKQQNKNEQTMWKWQQWKWNKTGGE